MVVVLKINSDLTGSSQLTTHLFKELLCVNKGERGVLKQLVLMRFRWNLESGDFSVVISLNESIKSLDFFLIRTGKLFVLKLLFVLSEAHETFELVWLSNLLLLHRADGN